jgi:hypothetical protein
LRGQGMSCVFQNIQKCVLVFFLNKEPFQQACGNCQKIAMEWLLMVSWSLRVRQIMCLIRSLVRSNQRLRNCFYCFSVLLSHRHIILTTLVSLMFVCLSLISSFYLIRKKGYECINEHERLSNITQHYR